MGLMTKFNLLKLVTVVAVASFCINISVLASDCKTLNNSFREYNQLIKSQGIEMQDSIIKALQAKSDGEKESALKMAEVKGKTAYATMNQFRILMEEILGSSCIKQSDRSSAIALYEHIKTELASMKSMGFAN